MIKLQDFAAGCGVTDRQIQRLIKKYENEIEGHFERKGPNGTWLDDEACQILRSKMKVKEVVLEDNRVSDLLQQIKELNERIERKDVIIERMQEREGQKDQRIRELEQQQMQLEGKVNKAIDAAKTELKLQLDEKHREELDSAVSAVKEGMQQKIDELNEKHNIEVDELQEELEREKNRKLTWRERITGKRKRD